MGYTPSKS